jgi:hypothetical protein
MGPGLWEVRILAPSPEKAEQWARALILVYNTGWAEPGRAEAQRLLKSRRAELERILPQVQEARAKLKEAQESLERFPDIDKDAQAALRSKRWSLVVDIAGVKARVDAISDMLHEKYPSSPIPPELATLQIAASVDFADLGARLKTTDMLLEQGAERAKLEPEFHKRKQELGAFQGHKDRLEADIVECEQLLSGPALAPLSIEGGKVTIQPITWQIQPNVPQPGGPMGPPFRPGE